MFRKRSGDDAALTNDYRNALIELICAVDGERAHCRKERFDNRWFKGSTHARHSSVLANKGDLGIP